MLSTLSRGRAAPSTDSEVRPACLLLDAALPKPKWSFSGPPLKPMRDYSTYSSHFCGVIHNRSMQVHMHSLTNATTRAWWEGCSGQPFSFRGCLPSVVKKVYPSVSILFYTQIIFLERVVNNVQVLCFLSILNKYNVKLTSYCDCKAFLKRWITKMSFTWKTEFFYSCVTSLLLSERQLLIDCIRKIHELTFKDSLYFCFFFLIRMILLWKLSINT
jgi:hypothetical protein